MLHCIAIDYMSASLSLHSIVYDIALHIKGIMVASDVSYKNGAFDRFI